MMTGAIELERSDLLREGDLVLRTTGLLALGRRLEAGDHLAEAAEIYAALAAERDSATGRQALAQLEALEGRGAFGARFEFLLRRFAEQASYPKTILPMFAASALSGAVRAFSYGRWIGWGAAEARLASGAAGFAAEVPAFVASGRALREIFGEKPGQTWEQDLASATLCLASLKIFNHAGTKLGRRLGLPLAPGATVAGLYQAQWLEESLGLRPAQRRENRLLEALSSYFALGVGAHLGRSLLGNSTMALGMEQELRERPWVSATPFAAGLSRTWAAMAAGVEGPSDGGLENRGSGKFPSREAEAKARNYVVDRPLSVYRNITSLTLMGDLLRNLEGRYLHQGRAPRVLDLGSGQGVAARQLKAALGDRVRVETLDRYPMAEGSDRHYEADWSEAQVEGDHDVILSIFGPHAHHEGDLLPQLDKALQHLAPEGEMVAVLTRGALRSVPASPLRRLENFSTIRWALERGVALRLEDNYDSFIFYARRLNDGTLPTMSEILSQGSAKDGMAPRHRALNFSESTVPIPEEALRALQQNLDELGVEPELRPGLAQSLFDAFRSDFIRDHHREPAPFEIQQWQRGEAPSPLWSKSLLVDAFLRAPSLLKKPAALAFAIGLGTFWDVRLAEAAPFSSEGLENAWAHPSVPVLAVLSALVVAGVWTLARRYLGRAPGENRGTPPLDFNNVDPSFLSGPAANDIEEAPSRNHRESYDPYPYLKEMPAGWVRKRRQEIERCLSDVKLSPEHRENTVEALIRQVVELKFSSSEALEAGDLLWELAFDKRLSGEFRQITFMVYRNLLGQPQAFPVGSPQVSREALRLRHIFSDPAYLLEKRVLAADAYGRLVQGLDLRSTVGFGEARVGRKALADFLESGDLKRGTRNYFYTNSPKVEIETRMREMGLLAEEGEPED